MSERELLSKIIENAAELCDRCEKPFYKDMKLCSNTDDSIEILCAHCHPITKLWAGVFRKQSNKLKDSMWFNSNNPIHIKRHVEFLGYDITTNPITPVEFIKLNFEIK
ncbi:MAG: hypothetical protein KAS32_06345 [Candidatus Peribacteraceae bacterium]|nr:hypothetical protein [Candidatus Peribacteraceae bacterium]